MPKRDKSHRHPKLKHIPHSDEHRRDDGSFDKEAAMKDAPDVMAAVQSGNPEWENTSQTDPGADGRYLVVFHMKAK